MRARTTRHQRYSDTCGGELTVYVTPLGRFDDHGKSAVDIGVTTPDGLVWAPTEPLWLSPLYDADSKSGRREAADAAVDFFEASACGADHNPAARKMRLLIRDADVGRAIIEQLHTELWAADSRAAGKLADAYRVARPRTPQEVSAFVEAYVDALNARAPDGVCFGTPTGDTADLGWWPCT